MVYCGKPSRGCQMCRTRRIKCDETKPTCLQCQKSRRQCPGYRDDFDLVFRNETQATERRARKSIYNKKVTLQAAQKAQQQRNDPVNSSVDSQETISPTDLTSFTNTLTVPAEQHALHYFLANFVLLPAKEGGRGFFDFLIPLLKNEPPDSHLSVSFNAVALAALGNRPNSKMLLVQASAEYSRALSYTNRALADPIIQKSDQTLAAVLLLGLFETITLRRSNMATWGTHIEGAVTLVRMRGKKQLRTKIGCSLFLTVRAQMLVNCLTASKSPEMGPDWWAADSVKDIVLATAIKLNVLVTELRADTNRAMTLIPRTPENFSKILELLRRAQELEQGYLDWIDNHTEMWHYKTIAWVDAIPGSDLSNSEVYPGRVDMYSDLGVAGMWNNVRVARLFLAGIVIRCAAWIVSPIDYRTTPEYASASRLGTEMINDMIASIPFHLGWSDGQGRDNFRTGGMSGFACGDDHNSAGKALGAYFLAWPLFTINCSDFTTDAQRRWVIGRLKYMSEIMGLSQASVLSHFQLRLPSMIVKRDGMGLAAPNPKILGSDLGKLPTAGYPTNPLTKMPIPLSASATNFKSSLFYSPVTANSSTFNANNSTGSAQSLGSMNLTSNNGSISNIMPIGNTSESFTNSNLPPVTTLGIINQVLGNNAIDLVTRIDTINASIGNNFSPATPVGIANPPFNSNIGPAQVVSSNVDPGSDNEDEMQIAEVAELEAKRRAERIAFARTFGDAIRSTTGDEVMNPFSPTLPLSNVSLASGTRLHTVQQAVDATWL